MQLIILLTNSFVFTAVWASVRWLIISHVNSSNKGIYLSCTPTCAWQKVRKDVEFMYNV